MDIKEILSKKDFEISELLRQNQIMAPGLAGIKEGYDKYGDAFVMKVVNILKDANNGFLNYNVDGEEIYFNGDGTIANGITALKNQPSSSSSDLFGKILSAIGTVGTTVNNITGKNNLQQPVYATTLPSAQSKLMLYLAGAAILVIGFLFFIKRKK